MKRIPPSKRAKEEIETLLKGRSSAESFEELRGRLHGLRVTHVLRRGTDVIHDEVVVRGRTLDLIDRLALTPPAPHSQDHAEKKFSHLRRSFGAGSHPPAPLRLNLVQPTDLLARGDA